MSKMTPLELRKFRRTRGDRGVSQRNMAKLLDISYSAYRRWESEGASELQQERAAEAVHMYLYHQKEPQS